MARISRTKKTLVVAAALALTIGGAGAAFAYWTSTGVGEGSAATGESVAFDITSVPGTGDELVPGGDGQVVDFTVTNPGPATQNLSAVVVTIAEDDGTAWVPTDEDCVTDDYTVTFVPPTYGPLLALAGRSGQATVMLAESGVNQDACQNEVVPLYITAA